MLNLIALFAGYFVLGAFGSIAIGLLIWWSINKWIEVFQLSKQVLQPYEEGLKKGIEIGKKRAAEDTTQ